MNPNDLPAEAFLNPEKNLATPWDKDELRTIRRKEGKQIGKDTAEFHIAINSVWGSQMKDGGHISSYECLGYHANTADFMRGVLESGCPIIVHRLCNGQIIHTKIQ